MNNKRLILIICAIIIVACAIASAFLITSNMGAEYKNITVGSATFEIPSNINGTQSRSDAPLGLASASTFNSSTLFIEVFDVGMLSNVINEEFIESILHGQKYSELPEKYGVKYYEVETPNGTKYMGMSNIGLILIVVIGDDLETIEHIFETVKISTSETNETANVTEDASSQSSSNSQSQSSSEYFIDKDTGEKVYYNYDPNKGQIITPDSPKSKYEDPRWVEANEIGMAG